MPTSELTVLARTAAARRRAEERAAKLVDDQEQAVRAARAADHSWAEIGEAMGISEGQAKWLVQRAKSSTSVPAADTHRGRGPGVGVSEAARLLGVTRRTVYMWADDGRLQATKNELGRTRILLSEDIQPERTKRSA